MSSQVSITPPGLFKLAACFVYDTLVVVAICFLCGWLFLLVAGDATHGFKRYLLQFVLWLAVGSYFVRCWHTTGQTLALKTWRLQVINEHQQLLSWPQAMVRYCFATVSFLCFGVGFLWAIFDPQHRYLHDRLLQSRIMQEISL